MGVFQGAHFLRNLGSLSLIALAPATGRSIMSRRAQRALVVACGLLLLRYRGWLMPYPSGLGVEI